jgi:hypothetical protein
MPTIQEMIEQVLIADDRHPMHEIMREEERASGHQVVIPGDEPWLAADDWHETIVVSRNGKEIRLIALYTSTPGRGAFRRTVSGILDAGLVPVIIAPTREMRETMIRWNWFPRHVGSGWNHEEQWRPRKGWRHAPADLVEINQPEQSAQGGVK